MQISSVPVAGWDAFINKGFGNRCNIDGQFFDEGGICNNGHEHGATYYREPEKKEVSPLHKQTSPTQGTQAGQLCAAVSGNRCSIDSSYFADGDDICQRGHQIGLRY